MVIGTDLTVETDFGNGATTEWPFGFRIDRAADLVVILVDPDGVETLLSEGSGSTDYIVNVARYPGSGSVTYPASGSGRLPAGWRIIRRRVVALVQGTDLKNQGAYKPEQVEAALDYGRMIDQQQQEALDRSIKAPLSGSANVNFDLPLPRAGHIWRWNADGTALENVPHDLDRQAAAAAAAAQDQAEAAQDQAEAARDLVLAIEADVRTIATEVDTAVAAAAASAVTAQTAAAAALSSSGGVTAGQVAILAMFHA